MSVYTAFILLGAFGASVVWLGGIVIVQRAHQIIPENRRPKPTYFTKHPDGTFTPANPPPK